jgi:hypothetical protein
VSTPELKNKKGNLLSQASGMFNVEPCMEMKITIYDIQGLKNKRETPYEVVRAVLKADFQLRVFLRTSTHVIKTLNPSSF